MTSSRGAWLLVTAFALTHATEALAQPQAPTAEAFETARTLYKEGKELRAKGDVKGALEKFEAAHALGRTPVTGIELARTYAAVGRLVEARELCLSIGRMPVAGDETSKSADARADASKLAEELRPRIASLAVQVKGLLAGETAHLVVDGAAVPDLALQAALKINPGKHEVVVRAGEGSSAREGRETPEIGEGEVREVTVTLPTPPPAPELPPPPPPPPPSVIPPPPPPPPAPPPSSSSPVLVRLGFGTAIAGGALGLIAGVQALSEKSQVVTLCPGGGCDARNSGPQALSSAYTWATVSTVSFGVAAAGLVAGIVGLVNGSHDSPKQQDQGVRVVPWVGAGMGGVYADF